MADTELPEWRLDERPKEVRCPDLTEVQSLLDAARSYDPRVGAFIRVVAATGARRGEACALRWSDIDWEAHAVRIDEAVIERPVRCPGEGARDAGGCPPDRSRPRHRG
ncbi:MAG: tyrosine-type recombinase/integrase [Acidimicrobiales bacterium]